ncbi:MAG TPA: hypothetical protein ENN58_03885 [bacterium]|nr:hypothetical protein [bacterium]
MSISCGSGDGVYSGDDFLFDDDPNHVDADVDVEFEFEFVLEKSSIDGTISRDLVSCGDSVVGGGEHFGNAFVFKMKNGKIIWWKEFYSYFVQSVNAVSCDSDGNVIVGGDRTKEGENRSTGFVAVLDKDGTLLWDDDIKSNGSTAVYAISYTDLGNFIAGGRTEIIDEDTSLSNIEGFLTKYNISGERYFLKEFGTPVFDTVQSVAMGADKFYFAGGHSAGDMATNGSTNNTESGMLGFLVKFKPNGEIHWRKNIEMNTVWKITGKQSGLIFAGGEKTVSEKRYGIVIQTGLDGKSQFEHHFDAHNGITVTGIDVDNQDNIYFTGYIESDFSKKNYTASDELISDTNNIFFAVFDIRTKDPLYKKFYGTEHQDLNPKVALDSTYTPYVLHYSRENFETKDSYITMTKFGRVNSGK